MAYWPSLLTAKAISGLLFVEAQSNAPVSAWASLTVSNVASLSISGSLHELNGVDALL